MKRPTLRVLLAEIAVVAVWLLGNTSRIVGIPGACMYVAGFPLTYLHGVGQSVDYFSVYALLINVFCLLVSMILAGWAFLRSGRT